MDCNKKLITDVGQHMTNDEFWKKFGTKLDQIVEDAMEGLSQDEVDDRRDDEMDAARDMIVDEENIKFTD